MAEMYSQGEIRIFREPFLLRSAFGRLVQGHLKALNHLRFALLLCFRACGTAQALLLSTGQFGAMQALRAA